MVEIAENRMCLCENDKSNIIFTDTIPGVEAEYHFLNGFYCTECNSFWREI